MRLLSGKTVVVSPTTLSSSSVVDEKMKRGEVNEEVNEGEKYFSRSFMMAHLQRDRQRHRTKHKDDNRVYKESKASRMKKNEDKSRRTDKTILVTLFCDWICASLSPPLPLPLRVLETHVK